MRTFRLLALSCAVAALPAAAAAQQGRHFENSWFWGAKAGIASFSTSMVSDKTAPLVGAEWLITRERFGLYIAADETFFDEFTGIPDLLGGQYQIAIKNLRRFTAAGLFFPKAFGSVRPYGGVGLSVNWIGDAVATQTFSSSGEALFVESTIAEERDRASFVMMAGVQGQWGRIAPFAQVTMQPSHTGFLINERPIYFLEGGIRINAGSRSEQ